jgi:hypothetical protein
MKLVAAKGFINVKKLGIKLADVKDEAGKVVLKNGHQPGADGNPLTNFIHKGARFSIGDGDDFKALAPDDQQTIKNLVDCGCMAMESDTKTVARIDREVAIENKKAASVKAEPSFAQQLADGIAAANKPILEALQAQGKAIADLQEKTKK